MESDSQSDKSMDIGEEFECESISDIDVDIDIEFIQKKIDELRENTIDKVCNIYIFK